jgi:hypothetical protein
MSYILDALRRLEQDKERTRRGTNPVEAVLVPDLDEPQRSIRRRWWWVGIGAALLAVVIGTTYWLTRRTLVFSTVQVQEGASPYLASAQRGEDRPASPSFPKAASQAHRPRPSGEEPSAPPGSRPTQSTLHSPSTPSPEREEAEIPTPSIQETASRPIGPGSRGQPPTSAREDVLATPKETVAMSRESPEHEVILPWEGEEIRINAIAWSRDKSQRFALVNLKTVHEGDRVQGLSVVEIEEDGVVFEQGGTKYRVRLSVGRR